MTRSHRRQREHLRQGLPIQAAALAVLAVLTLVIVPVVAASADQQVGAAIDLGRIEVAEPLVAGQGYALPTLRVRNPGTVTTDYRMVAQPIARTTPALDGAWVGFTPPTFTLAPGETQPVHAELVPARDAVPGDYEALLAVQAIPGGDGIAAAAAAAAYLTFTIESRPAATPWGVWLLLALLMVAVMVTQRRRRRTRRRHEPGVRP